MPPSAKAPVSRRRALHALAAAAASAGLPARAQDAYPSRPVTLIIPGPPGGATDFAARLIGQRLSERLGQPFVIDYHAGANGLIGMDIAARAAPNGYTLLFNTAGAQTLSPVLYKTKVRPLDDWEPISQISATFYVIVANNKLPVQDFAGVAALGRRGEPPLKAASGSSLQTLVTEEIKRAIGAPTLIIVPYKGTAPQAQAVLAGEVDISVDSFVTSIANVKAGKLRPLAVTSIQRAASLPDVPTLEELGYKGMVFGSWTALLAPKGTPQAIVERLSAEVQAIVREPEVQERFRRYDHTPVGSTGPELAQLITSEYARWQRIVKETGYRVDN
jgi:tripartite-type tricarboxylate transporter receptor subunit TctC